MKAAGKQPGYLAGCNAQNYDFIVALEYGCYYLVDGAALPFLEDKVQMTSGKPASFQIMKCGIQAGLLFPDLFGKVEKAAFHFAEFGAAGHIDLRHGNVGVEEC